MFSRKLLVSNFAFSSLFGYALLKLIDAGEELKESGSVRVLTKAPLNNL